MITANGHKITPTIFPDGTSQVWKVSPELFKAEKISIEWRFEAEREFFDLCSLVLLVYHNQPDIYLHMPYFPYARQDKKISNETTFNGVMFTFLLRQLPLARITALDVHNPDPIYRTIENFENLSPASLHNGLIAGVLAPDFKPDYLIFPDMGAFKRYPHLNFMPRIIMDKTRDQATGKLLSHNIVSEKEVYSHQKGLIIDDICDGGATFLSVAKTMKEKWPDTELGLFVTHGIFSKGKKILEEAGLRVFTTNSYGNMEISNDVFAV